MKWRATLRTSVSWIISLVISMLSFTYSRKDGSKKNLLSFQSKSSYILGQNRKVLVLDLDETLVHATTKPLKNIRYDMVLDVILEGICCRFYVKKRPFLEAFLNQVCEFYDVVIFTASLRSYADPVIDMIDPKRLIKVRLFRDSCINRGGFYIKDLRTVYHDLSKIMIIDNSPIAYSLNKENAIPISDWFGDDPSDQALRNILPFLLDVTRFSSDVRSSLMRLGYPSSQHYLGSVWRSTYL